MRTATPNAMYTHQGAKPACQQDIQTKFSHLPLAQLPRTQFTHSKAPNPHASKTSTQNFRTSYWHSYPERNLHTASRQTHTPARHPHMLFASPIGTATAQLPRTQFTHSKPPNPHARKTSTQTFRISYRHSYPERNLHTASRQTRAPGRHQCKLLSAQLPRKQFTHSTPPNPHARKTSTQTFRTSYRQRYPERKLHTASRQTRMPGRHQRNIFASPIGTATAQLPRTQFTHSTPPNPHARKTSTQTFRISYRHSYPERKLHTASRQTRMPGRHQRNIFASTPNAIYTQQAAKPACQEDINTQKQRPSGGAQNALKHTSNPAQALQAPRLPRKSSGRAAEPKTRQTPRSCSKPRACHAKAAAERRSPKRAKAYIRPCASAASPTPATQKQRHVHQTPRKCSKSHACHAKAAAERRSPKRAKAYIRPLAAGPSPTQKQRPSNGTQNAPKRTSDPARALQVSRLPRKSSGRPAEPKTRQSVHQTPRSCSKPHACHAKAAAERKTRQSVHQTPRKRSKPHACHAKAAAERRSPKRAKAYIRPLAAGPSPTPATQKSSGRAEEPKTRQSVHQTPRKCSKPHTGHAKAAAERRSPKGAKAYIRPRAAAASPTPATQKQRQSGGSQNAPKRTSNPAQLQHSKSHACHAKAAAERRSPKSAKAYIRPRASAPSPTPATQKQRQSGRAQNAPKRTSGPAQLQQAPRLPRKSSRRAAEPKTRQSVHQTPCRRSKPHATQKQRPSGGAQNAPKRTSDPVQLQQVPRLPRKKQRQSGSAYVNLCDVKLCDVKLCDVKRCDVKLCDVKRCDVKLCDVKLCDVKLCVVCCVVLCRVVCCVLCCVLCVVCCVLCCVLCVVCCVLCVVLCCVVLLCVVALCVVLRVVLCCVVLCCVALCCVVLRCVVVCCCVVCCVVLRCVLCVVRCVVCCVLCVACCVLCVVCVVCVCVDVCALSVCVCVW